ncbi:MULTISPECIES: S1C family serine protease [Clostridium]|uniref:Serine protease Do-like HtrB n=2 Tax=Clostridium TaxID=1485 RepID=A0A151ALX1_9CLOT|nr:MULTISPECIES: trypsin-like peptidase domain-containing protein [Clostridium]KYH28645.1 serine protease Do-like HtrB [Clostridium colicanis DSM 13634]MBE6045018.1 PDZ domain-containing protein [Clostridium thermopalmarium]PRR73351.1 Serine protease Do-like HtrB [Clostridium thermopalmarium DSM 5974]PVZ22163.1 serine protease Do [Clostridium thermopalmarium DSM 5974]
MQDNHEVKEVNWESISDEKYGAIKFRKRKNNIKSFFRGVAFILIAAVSGAVSSSYMIEKKYSQKAKVEDKSIDEELQENPYSDIAKVANIVGPTVVGIIKTSPNDSQNVNNSSGSGIIFRSNGYIVTNYNIIDGAEEINVKLARGQKYLKAKFIGSDPDSGLAIIKVEAQNLPVAKFGDSSKMRVGDIAIAIGNPLGEEFTGSVTAGVISALNRKIQYGKSTYKVLQTDVAMNEGNSGGALCNLKGEIIGINNLNLKDTQFKNEDGMGFAIASNEVKNIINEIMEYGKAARPDLGIYGRDAVSNNNDGVKGVYVTSVTKGSGAEKAGIMPTDIIVEIEKKKITKFEDMAGILGKYKIGDTVKCKIWRNGNNIDMTIELADMENK